MSIERAKYTTAGGRLAFGSVGAGYAALLTTPQSVKMLTITNSLNVECVVSFNGGTTDNLYLPALTGVQLDFAASELNHNGTISVKQGAAGAPASGMIAAFAITGQ